MADPTEHFGFDTLGPGDSLSDNDYKFGVGDRQLQDLLLHLSLNHRHTGGTSALTAPVAAPNLVLSDVAGAIPAATRVYYAYTLLDPNGLESGPSPTTFIDTPPQVVAPAAPTWAVASTGGALLPGNYWYVLTAYTGPNNSETAALNPVYIVVPGTTSTNMVTLTLPALPAGADGFNVYRKKPGGSKYFYLTSIDMSGGTPPTTYVDTDADAEDCDRNQPVVNTTQAVNQVTVTVPALPAAGWQWRLYRSYSGVDWTSTVLSTLPHTDLDAVDLGGATTTGAPPGADQVIPIPTKVDLEDGAEVEGRLPLSQISGFPQTIEFSFPGPTALMSGTGTWICEYPQFRVTGVRASLGRGYQPAQDPVIVDVNKGSGVTPTYTTIFTTQGNRPSIPVAQQMGARTIPDVVELVEGDSMTCDVDQIGGGANTDRDLVVTVYGIAYGYTDPLSMDW